MKNVYFYIVGSSECLLKKPMDSPPRMGEKVRLSGGGQGDYIVHDVINHIDIESPPSQAQTPQNQTLPQPQGTANVQHAAQQMLAQAQIQMQQLKMQQAQQTQQQSSVGTVAVEVILRQVFAMQQS